MTLNQLRPGDKGTIKSIQGEGIAQHRLIEMGLIEDTEIQLIRIAPLGDPIEVALDGFNLSLRKNEAKMIELK